jgi:hypothetical protein
MTNTPFHLYQLQKIDSRLAAIDSRSKEISRLLENDPVLIAARSEFEAAKRELESSSATLQVIESKILDRRNKLEQSESSLYSGMIKNPKELQDLQKEIASIKSAIALMEDEQMIAMLEVEEKEKIFRTFDLKRDQANAANQQANVALTAQAEAIAQEKARLVTERKLLAIQVPGPILHRYEDLRSRKGGVAVGKVDDQTCTLCGTGLTPSQCQSAKSPSVLFFCPSCGRILYAD